MPAPELGRIVRVHPTAPDAAVIDEAAAVLLDGGLVAFPTETVYGLGALAIRADAVARIFAAKGRPRDNPLIVHIGSAAHLDGIAAEVTPLARHLADAHWPGPLTIVLDAGPGMPEEATAGLGTVAVRVPAHPVALALLQAVGAGVAAPSANASGRPSPTRAEHVAADLGSRVDLILDAGPCLVGLESTVVDARGTTPVVLREGAISREDLGAADTVGDLRASPGTRHRHYAPTCQVVVAEPRTGGDTAAALAASGARTGLVARGPAPTGVIEVARFDSPTDLAVGLYAWLRAAESEAIDVLVVEGVPEEGLGRAVMDRLRRAAEG